MKRVVHAHLTNAILIGEPDGFLHRGEGGGLAEFKIRIPNFGGSKSAGNFLDDRARHAAARLAAKVFVKVQRLNAVVRADAMRAGHVAEAGGIGRFLRCVTAVLVGGFD